MNLDVLLANLSHPPVLFFFMGLIAIFVKSDLEIPEQIAKYLSIYLLFDIGIKGGEELFHSGLSMTVVKVMISCVILSFTVPFIVYRILRIKLDVYNASAIAAAYGSISAVTFATTAMRITVPQANMSLLLPMTLGVTFTFNVSIGIPVYFAIITKIWS